MFSFPSPARCLPHLAAALTLTACQLEQPPTAAGTYHAEMQPLMAQNVAVARSLQSLAADIKKESPDADKVAERLESKVLPGVRGLAQSVAAVRPQDADIADAHGLIVDAWEARVGVVEDTLAAWRAADADAADAAVDERYSASRAEALYFERINEILVPEGYVLQPYGGR
jgi:hypothetical protein